MEAEEVDPGVVESQGIKSLVVVNLGLLVGEGLDMEPIHYLDHCGYHHGW